MRMISLVFLVAVIVTPDRVKAQADQVLTGPSPSWVEVSEPVPVPADAAGTVFMRRSDLIVHLEDEGQHTYLGQRMKLLHPQALAAGNLSITWNPAAGAPVVHMLRIYRDGEEIDVLADTSFEVLRREEQLEQAILTGNLTAVLRVPDLRVGDELEWAFTSPSHDPTLADNDFGFLMFGPAPPPGRYRVSLRWEEGQEPTTQLTEDLAGFEERGPASLTLSVENPEMLAPPPDAPPRYSWQRIVEYSDFASWSAVSQRFDALFDVASQLSETSPVREEATRIASAHSGDLERAQAALELVQQQVRYIYVGLDGGNYEPATADETWQRRYGDCKGKSALLMALLNELGIDAELVLVNNAGGDDGADARLPNPALFDHILVRADIGGSTYWMDPTLPAVIEPGLTPFLPYRWVLPLSENGASLEQIRHEPFALPQEIGLIEIDARAGFQQPARRINTSVTRGFAGLNQYALLSAMTPSQLTNTFRSSLTGQGTWDEIESVTYRYDRQTQASILTIVGSGPVDWDDRGDGRYRFALPGGGFSPPPRRQRSDGSDADTPFYTARNYSCYVTTVRVPEETDVTNWSFNSMFDTMMFGKIYYRVMERRDDGTIRMIRGSRVEVEEIAPERAHRDNGRLDNFDNSMAWIFYDPDRSFPLRGRFPSVPATYEIDWSGSDVPCLPADVLQSD
ncbi:MAG: DUF3857 domain-containing transglutaminase family protein [Parasphingopyxis sp.]|uniref:DUF3857 domain-containing transglutaminase family protein n=1 Tax=Parasphingopyxis sp. TaxID=1920299 RepID=UPI003FA13F3F